MIEAHSSLEQKVAELKTYKRIFKHSQSIQCKHCARFHPTEAFVAHMGNCYKESASNMMKRSAFLQMPLSIAII